MLIRKNGGPEFLDLRQAIAQILKPPHQSNQCQDAGFVRWIGCTTVEPAILESGPHFE